LLHVSGTGPDGDAVLLTDSGVQVGNPPSLTASNKIKAMAIFNPRIVMTALCAATFVLSASAAQTQNADKPADQKQQSDSGKEAQKIDEFAEAARLVNGPAGNAECVWLGRRVISLMWRDDLDTAFRHLDLYDRFGCPAAHIQSTFRCLVRQGNIDPKVPESLNGRVHACWINPNLPATPAAATPSAAAPASGAK